MTRQTDGKSLYEQQEERILAQSDAFISLLTKRGILGDHQIDNEKVRKAKQEKNRKSYHNTQLLLQHYRNIAWLLECLPVDVAAELDEPFEGVDKLIDQMDLEIALGNRKLENRMEGIVKSRLLFDRVNEALTVLSHKPGDGQKLYDVIYHIMMWRLRTAPASPLRSPRVRATTTPAANTARPRPPSLPHGW